MKIQIKNKLISSFILRISKIVEKSYVLINLKSNNKFKALSRRSRLRFAVISDVHIAPTKCLEKRKFRNIFSTMYNLDSNMDAIAIVGDLTDNGSKEEYNSFKKILDKNKKKETILVASMGNHEQNTPSEFSLVTGRNPRENLIINGYHFITVSPRLSEDTYGGNKYNLDEIWMKEQLEYARLEDVYKPIFVFIHHGIKNTAYGTDQW
ncbi:MAG TPA: metallophosphoesterase, partial [Clostridium sp.]